MKVLEQIGRLIIIQESLWAALSGSSNDSKIKIEAFWTEAGKR